MLQFIPSNFLFIHFPMSIAFIYIRTFIIPPRIFLAFRITCENYSFYCLSVHFSFLLQSTFVQLDRLRTLRSSQNAIFYLHTLYQFFSFFFRVRFFTWEFFSIVVRFRKQQNNFRNCQNFCVSSSDFDIVHYFIIFVSFDEPCVIMMKSNHTETYEIHSIHCGINSIHTLVVKKRLKQMSY